MTTDEKARDLALAATILTTTELMLMIADALLAARREGIEEAAKVVELYAFPAKKTIAAAIRALP